MNLVVAPEALADMTRLRRFLEQQNADAAARAISLIEDAIQSLATLPNRGRASGVSGLRELAVPFGNSAYVIRYGVVARTETVLIVRVWHGRETR